MTKVALIGAGILGSIVALPAAAVAVNYLTGLCASGCPNG